MECVIPRSKRGKKDRLKGGLPALDAPAECDIEVGGYMYGMSLKYAPSTGVICNDWMI